MNSSDHLPARHIGGYTPSLIEERWTGPLHGRLIRTLHLAGKGIPRFRIGHRASNLIGQWLQIDGCNCHDVNLALGVEVHIDNDGRGFFGLALLCRRRSYISEQDRIVSAQDLRNYAKTALDTGINAPE